MEKIENLTLGEIVKIDYKTAAIFEKFSLDFCCMGDRNFMDACKEENIEPTHVKNELLRVINQAAPAPDFVTWSLDFLIDYIVKKHHKYVEEKTVVIRTCLDKICRVHGIRHPELIEIQSIFFNISSGLAVHMKKEELMLFPFIRKIERTAHINNRASSPFFKSVKDLIEIMKADHSEEGEEFRRIADLTNHYKIPADACNTFELTYKLLDEFEKDLHIHIHLENNILFPRAIEVEQLINSIN